MDKIRVPSLQEMKRRGQKIVALTSYDFSTTQLLNAAGVDVILIGDSLGMTKLGYDSTLPVTVEDMLYHTRIVAKGLTLRVVRRALRQLQCLRYQLMTACHLHSGQLQLRLGAFDAMWIRFGEPLDLLPRISLVRTEKSANYEWLDAIDACNMVDVCELIILSSLERKESRGPFMRRDFPLQDNARWVAANVMVRTDNGHRFDLRPYDLPFFKPDFAVKDNLEVAW